MLDVSDGPGCQSRRSLRRTIPVAWATIVTDGRALFCLIEAASMESALTSREPGPPARRRSFREITLPRGHACATW